MKLSLLNEEFANVWDWFVDSYPSVHFGEEQTKCFLFSRDKNLSQLNLTSNIVWKNTLVVMLMLT